MDSRACSFIKMIVSVPIAAVLIMGGTSQSLADSQSSVSSSINGKYSEVTIKVGQTVNYEIYYDGPIDPNDPDLEIYMIVADRGLTKSLGVYEFGKGNYLSGTLGPHNLKTQSGYGLSGLLAVAGLVVHPLLPGGYILSAQYFNVIPQGFDWISDDNLFPEPGTSQLASRKFYGDWSIFEENASKLISDPTVQYFLSDFANQIKLGAGTTYGQVLENHLLEANINGTTLYGINIETYNMADDLYGAHDIIVGAIANPYRSELSPTVNLIKLIDKDTYDVINKSATSLDSYTSLINTIVDTAPIGALVY